VVALAGLRFNQGDLLFGTKSTKPSGKGAGHLWQLTRVDGNDTSALSSAANWRRARASPDMVATARAKSRCG
jgi:hypothetical protein